MRVQLILYDSTELSTAITQFTSRGDGREDQ